MSKFDYLYLFLSLYIKWARNKFWKGFSRLSPEKASFGLSEFYMFIYDLFSIWDVIEDAVTNCCVWRVFRLYFIQFTIKYNFYEIYYCIYRLLVINNRTRKSCNLLFNLLLLWNINNSVNWFFVIFLSS